jgi:hypothetical protein
MITLQPFSSTDGTLISYEFVPVDVNNETI